MKPLNLLCIATLGMLGVAGPIQAALQTPSKVLLAQAQTDKIAQVANGTLKTAHASWWGFDKTDATETLQKAIDSGVSTLIVDNMGSDWIINKPIQLVSHQQVIFEDGVVVQAKKGMFKGKKDPLFNANTITDFALIGRGNVIFRMHRADYDNRDLYEKAEWRHGIALRDCKNAIIRGLTVEETGGDGLYLGASANGYNKNILVENCTFDRNYRQGVSVISAEDLVIRNSKLINTGADKMGTAPQAGIDFEPNGSGQRIVNCVLQNCELSGNAGGGVVFSIRQLGLPVSVTLDDCYITNNKTGGLFSSIDGAATVIIKNSTFDHDEISLRNARTDQRFVFRNNTVDASNSQRSSAPIMLTARHDLRDTVIGNIAFKNTTVHVNKGQDPLGFNLLQGSFGSQLYGISLSDKITGSLTVKEGNTSQKINLKKYIKQKQQELRLADPGYVLRQEYKDVQTFDITPQWRFLPDAATEKNVASVTFDDSDWATIDAGNWWQKQGFKYRGIAWYRKSVDIPALSNGQKAFLYFDGVDGSAEVYVNGIRIGAHLLGPGYAGWDVPFQFEITDVVKPGNNIIAIQVTSKSIDTASGINQPVHIGIGMAQ